MFLVSWMAWNNTLRPEPIIALLAAVALWAATRFASTPSPGPWLLGVVCSALAVSVHPAGVVSLAPLVLALPAARSWVQANGRQALVLLIAPLLLAAALVVLVVLSAGDMDFLLRSMDQFRAESEHSAGLLEEHLRYSALFESVHSNSIRRLSVLLPLCSLVTFILRHSRRRSMDLDTPILAFALSLLLLTLTPSKWIWHFGSLAPVAAAAVAVETYRWKNQDPVSPRHRPMLAAAFVSVVVIAAWADGWFGWNLLALERFDNLQVVTEDLGLPAPIALMALVTLLVCVLHLLLRRHPHRARYEAVHRLSYSIAPISAFIAIGLTLAIFTADGVFLTRGWSPAKQNLAQILEPTCGAAEDVRVHLGRRITVPFTDISPNRSIPTAVSSAHPWLDFYQSTQEIGSPDTGSPFKADTWSSQRRGPSDVGWFASPWFSISDLDRQQRDGLLIQAAGRLATFQNNLYLQTAGETGSDIDHRSLIEIFSTQDSSSWDLVNIGFEVTDPSIEAFRLLAVDAATDPGGWMAFSQPYFHESSQSLVEVVDSRGGSVLVAPQIRMNFPCFQQPKIDRGLAEIPSVVVSAWDFPMGLAGSPYRDLGDSFELRQFPTTWRERHKAPPFEVLIVESTGP
jgi:hypothetical protein